MNRRIRNWSRLTSDKKVILLCKSQRKFHFIIEKRNALATYLRQIYYLKNSTLEKNVKWRLCDIRSRRCEILITIYLIHYVFWKSSWMYYFERRGLLFWQLMKTQSLKLNKKINLHMGIHTNKKQYILNKQAEHSRIIISRMNFSEIWRE